MKRLIKILIILGILGLLVGMCYKIYLFNKEKIENEFDLGKLTKNEVFLLIEKGVKESSNIKIFIYSTELFNDDSLMPIFVEDEYKEILDIIDIFEYKNEKYDFITYRHTNDFVWGFFLEEGKELEEKIYIVIDKKSGKLKSLNKNTMQVIVY